MLTTDRSQWLKAGMIALGIVFATGVAFVLIAEAHR